MSIFRLISGPMTLLFGKRTTASSGIPPLVPLIWDLMRDKRPGASFQSKHEMHKNFNPGHDGLLLDGHKHRLTERESFAHLVLMAPSRMGKTTRYVIPNILTLAQQGASMVISDLKGDIHRQTSGYLRQQGYDIQVLNLGDPHAGSSCLNPLAGLRTYGDISEVAHVLVHSANPESYEKDPVWPRGAETLLKVVIATLVGMKDPSVLNLPNVLHALQSMGKKAAFEDWVCRYAPENAYKQYTQLVTGNENMMRSYYAMAVSALDFLNDEMLSLLFATDGLDFRNLRKRKTAFYLIVPPLKLSEYGPIMNLVYTRLFNVLMQQLPGPQDKSVYLMGDEWGHTAVPNFEAVATTIAQYSVSLSIVLQSLSQMEKNYGKAGARTILEGGMSAKLFLGALDVDTAQWASDLAGREIVSESFGAGRSRQYQQNLFNADRIRTMSSHEGLLIHSNREPALLREMVYSFEHPQFKRWTRMTPAPFPAFSPRPLRYAQI